MADLLDSENRALRSSLKDRYRLGDILGRSAAMQAFYLSSEIHLKKNRAAFHLFVVRRHGSLFVKDGQNILGLILFSDVYKRERLVNALTPLTLFI